MLGEIANIIQHPRGRYKEAVLRENRLVARDETVQVLHYIAAARSLRSKGLCTTQTSKP
jgi:hypothetical protein